MEAFTGGRAIWAWGTVGNGPGFEDITYTANDGFGEADIEGDDAPRLERHLFTVEVSDPSDVEDFASKLEAALRSLVEHR